ncbi:uncharacterized protein [Montipora capricornis]|uniref:uncharacterized protein n=1 Tax=Montipora capricornis TaxID=246305 RepID=UPI0035F149F1
MKPLVVALFGSVIFVLWMGRSSSGKLFGKLNWKQRSHSKEVRQNVIKKQSNTSPNFLSMTDNGPAGVTNVKQPGANLAAAVGDGTSDDTSAIQAIINHAARTSNNQVFFPPGEYLVSRDIVIRGSVEISGTESGIAIIKASIPYAKKIYNASPVNAVALKHLWLDGIRVEFNGGAQGISSTNDIEVFSCVFFSTASPTVTNAEKQQLKLAHLTNCTVERCVFLRDSSAFGVASKFSKTKRLSFNDNVCGLALSKVDWLSTELEPARDWLVQKQKLGFLKTHYNLADDQGFFKSCLYDQCDEEMRIYENVFNGSPNTGSLHKDHVVYLKGFKTMVFEKNYARGWPADPSGGIKARNGEDLWLARNYIDGTGILMYTHNKTKNCLNDGFENVVIYGNHIVQRSNYGHRASGISYYEPHFTGRDENVKYSANEFEFIGVSNPFIYDCIWLTNADLSHHHVYQDNVYYGTSGEVRLEARHSTPSFQTGNISIQIKNRFNYLPYKLNIPTY